MPHIFYSDFAKNSSGTVESIIIVRLRSGPELPANRLKLALIGRLENVANLTQSSFLTCLSGCGNFSEFRVGRGAVYRIADDSTPVPVPEGTVIPGLALELDC